MARSTAHTSEAATAAEIDVTVRIRAAIARRHEDENHPSFQVET